MAGEFRPPQCRPTSIRTASPCTAPTPRGFRQAFVREGTGGVPLVCVHGWPESKRIFWKVIEPLAAAGFEVIVPDLRGFGDSDVGPDGFHDVASHALDLLRARARRARPRAGRAPGRRPRRPRRPGPGAAPPRLGRPHGAVQLAAAVRQGARWPGMRTRPAREASDYFVRQGTDADALAAELATPEQRRRYIATFYTSRFWAHPGAFVDAGSRRAGAAPAPASTSTPSRSATPPSCGPASAATRASFDAGARSEPTLLARNERTPTLILFGPSDHVLYPDFDRMAATVFTAPRRPVPAARLRPLRAVGGARPARVSHRAFCGDLLAAAGRSPLSRG